MAFAPTFGAVGDFIAVSIIVKDLVVAIYQTRASSDEYKQVTSDLNSLGEILLQVDSVCKKNSDVAGIEDLRKRLEAEVEKSRDKVEAFATKLRKYGLSLQKGGSGNLLKDAKKRILWLTEKEDLAKFQTDMRGHVGHINMLLATMTMNLLSLNSRDKRQATPARSSTPDEMRGLERALGKCIELMQTAVPELATQVLEVVSTNSAVFREVMALRNSLLPTHPNRPILDDYFLLEDAIGRLSPVHLTFINSWQAFDAVLKSRFTGRPGARRVAQGRYVLHDNTTGRKVDQLAPLDVAVARGQKLNMSLLCQSLLLGDINDAVENTCPRCNAPSICSTGSESRCASCNMIFQRIEDVTDQDETYTSLLPQARTGAHMRTSTKSSTSQTSRDPRESPREDLSGTPSKKRSLVDHDLAYSGVDSDEEDITTFTRVKIMFSRRKRRRMSQAETNADAAAQSSILAEKISPHSSAECGDVTDRLKVQDSNPPEDIRHEHESGISRGESDPHESQNDAPRELYVPHDSQSRLSLKDRQELNWCEQPEHILGKYIGGMKVEDFLNVPSSLFGKLVYSAIHEPTGHVYALKVFSKYDRNMVTKVQEADVLKQEIKIHAILSEPHRHILKLLKLYDEPSYISLQYELCPGGDLFDAIQDRRYIENDYLIHRDLRQMIAAVAYCHDNNIYHRGLSPEHFLLTNPGGGAVLKLASFGLSSTEKYQLYQGRNGTAHVWPDGSPSAYAAPETFAPVEGFRYLNSAMDIWSLGIILINMVTMRNPWPAAYQDRNYECYVAKPDFLMKILPISFDLCKALQHILTDPEKRVGIHELDQLINRRNCPRFLSDNAYTWH